MHTADKHFPARTAAGPRRKYRPDRGRPADPMDTVSLNGDCVRDPAGAEIGRIEGVMLDASRDRIAYAILSLGGARGADERLFAVPWSVLSVNADDACVVLNIARERLKAAPGFDRNRWPSITDPGWREAIDAYYGVRPQRLRGHEHS